MPRIPFTRIAPAAITAVVALCPSAFADTARAYELPDAAPAADTARAYELPDAAPAPDTARAYELPDGPLARG